MLAQWSLVSVSLRYFTGNGPGWLPSLGDLAKGMARMKALGGRDPLSLQNQRLGRLLMEGGGRKEKGGGRRKQEGGRRRKEEDKEGGTKPQLTEPKTREAADGGRKEEGGRRGRREEEAEGEGCTWVLKVIAIASDHKERVAWSL